MSTDRDSGSGDETDGGLTDFRRWDVIDQIMRSFCSSLDSKIATITNAAAKKEPRESSVSTTPPPPSTVESASSVIRRYSGCWILVTGQHIRKCTRPIFCDTYSASTAAIAEPTTSVVRYPHSPGGAFDSRISVMEPPWSGIRQPD
ncbi:hypothetical protein MFIFM68171_06997 [Madurella fahalii]|uniref:Uncharacterized protein n=1 Tax=Madurella fahalii TaxID=1157608 RepID=A0ABQ0GGB4_9PEZI